MKIIEVTKSFSIHDIMDKNLNYIEYELLSFENLSLEVIRQNELLDFNDFGFIVFVDLERENYLKYITLKHAIGFTDNEVLWISSSIDESVSNSNDVLVGMSQAEILQFQKVNRKILSIHDEKGILISIMRRYHDYSQKLLNQSAQVTIQKIMKSMLGFLGEGILILDSDKKIIFMNVVAEGICGYSESLTINQPFFEIFQMINSITKEPIVDVLSELSIQNPTIGLPHNTILIDRNGQERFISANVSFLYKSLLQGYFIILRDVSRIVLTENNFRRISKAVEYSPTSVIMFKIDSEIEYVNPTFEAVSGFRYDEIVGQSIRILTVDEHIEALHEEMWTTINSGKVWDGTLKRKKKSGELYYERVHVGPIFNEQGVIDRFVTINQDITHELEMSDQIKNERNNFYSLINTAPIGLMLFNVENKFTNINNRAAAIIRNMGISTEWLLEFEEISTKETLLNSLLDVLNNKTVYLQKEFRFAIDNKDDIYLRLGAVPFVDASIESVLIAIDDVTSNKRIEKQLEVARDEAKEADKAKSLFLANMSHEIRTPINGIIGMTDITLTNHKLCEEDEANLKLVKLSSKNLLQIVNDILDISKLDAGKINFETIPFNVEMILLTTLKMFEAKAAAKELEFKIVIEDSAKQMLVGDPYRLQQCVTNLVTNALKFTEVGYVKVTVRELPLEQVEHNFILQILVEDSGIGISGSEKSALFKRFSQVDSSITRQFGGTGLGLAITKTLVQMQKGTILVDSEKGKGSCFTLQIPYEICLNNQMQQESVFVPVVQEKKEMKILIVEDEPINQRIIKKYLADYAETLDVASDGTEAIAFAKSKHYDIVFMDIQLPGMSGVDVMKVIKQLFIENEVYTPIIAVTANALKGDRERFLLEGFDYYVSKPYNKEVLMRSIDKVYNEEFLELRKAFHAIPIPNMIEIIAGLDQHVEEAFEKRKYAACANYIGELRIIAKGFGYINFGQKLLKLQMLLRKEDYETFSLLHSELKDSMKLINLAVW